MTFRHVILAAVFSTAATWTSPGSGPAAEEAKREAPETKWQLAQGPRGGEAAVDEERKKRSEGREQQREPRRSEPESFARPPAKAAPVQHEPRRGPRNEEEQSRRKEQPPRIEARPPAQRKIIVDDPRRRDKEQSNRNEPSPRIEARPPVQPVQPKIINTEPSKGDDARKDLSRRGTGDDQRNVRDDGRQKSFDARTERHDDRKEVREERRDPRGDRQDGRYEARDHRDERRDHRAGPPFHRLDELKGLRKQWVEQGGRTIIEEPDRRIIVKEQGRTIIRHDESERFRRRFKDVREERRNGLRIVTFIGPDGVHVISEYDEHDRLVRRYRRHRDGRTIVLIDNRHHHHHGPGFVTGLVIGALLNLPPPRVHIPREKYIVEYEDASYEDVYEALSAPPVEELDRGYTLDEIRYNYALLERMRRVDLDSITFDFGSWEVAPDQYGKLERIARAINRVLEQNPDEIFLIEGHTDAVGSEEDNLTLSDRRAETVAMILSDEFGVPPENLVTQGYGEQFLKIPTEGPERANRRVSIRRITPLMSRAEP